MPRQKTGNPVGRPRAIDSLTQDAIFDRLLSGEDLVSICESADMPSISTVHREMNRNPGFASQIRLGREGFGEQLFHKILQAAENITPENVSGMTAKIRVWQWAAVRCAPRLFSERVAAAQTSAPAVSATNVQINNIDMKSMTTE
jgi:hypothetical protein